MALRQRPIIEGCGVAENHDDHADPHRFSSPTRGRVYPASAMGSFLPTTQSKPG